MVADRIRELEAEVERLREAVAAPDWGEQYLREMDERKRQGDRAHKWKARAEMAALHLRYAIDALEGSPWTGWSTSDARDFLMYPETALGTDEIQDGGPDGR